MSSETQVNREVETRDYQPSKAEITLKIFLTINSTRMM